MQKVGLGSSVGIATPYRLDGPRIESRWGGGTDFPHLYRPMLGLTKPVLYNGYLVSFPGIKRPGRGVNHPPPSSTEVKERVELYFFLYVPSWQVVGRA